MQDRATGLRAVARVLIQNERAELLLCRSRDGSAWVPPGGTLDPGENLSIAARREAEEEAGLEVHLGRLIYLQEFKPAHREEHVIEVAFQALALSSAPTGDAAERCAPAGRPDRPWSGWFIQDVDGPRREVRWFTKEEMGKLADPVYPPFLKDKFWEGGHDPYLGLVRAE